MNRASYRATMRFLCLIPAVCLAATAEADHGVYVLDVEPGRAMVDTDRLQNYRATWQQLLIGDEGLVDSGATFEESLTIDHDQLQHTQSIRSGKGTVVTESRAFEKDTLRPMSLLRTMQGGPEGSPQSVSLQRSGLSWSGQATFQNGQQTPFSYVASHDSFDGWVAGLALAALPLELGYEAKLPALVQLQHATYLLHVRVSEKREKVLSPNHSVAVWVVDTEWVNMSDGSISPGGEDQSGGSYLIAVAPQPGQPHVIEYANNGAVIRWLPDTPQD